MAKTLQDQFAKAIPTNPNFVPNPDNVATSTPEGFNQWRTFERVGFDRSQWDTGTLFGDDTMREGSVTMLRDDSAWQQFWGQYATVMNRSYFPSNSSLGLWSNRESIVSRLREGWDLVPSSSLANNPDVQANPPEMVPFVQGLGENARDTNTLPNNLVWVRYRDRPTTADAAASTASPISMQEQIDLVSEAFREQTEWATERNIALTPQLMTDSMRYAMQAASRIDSRTQQAFANLGITSDEILGGMNMAMGLAQEYMTGQVPQDVQDQMARALAERGIQTNTYGSPLADLSYARNLGLTSMGLQQYGMSMYPQLAQQTMALGQQFIPGTMNLPGLYSNTMNMLGQSRFVGVSDAMQLGAQSAQGAANNALSLYGMLLQRDYGNYWSGMNLVTQMQMAQLQAQTQMQANAAMNATARRNAALQAAAGIGGNLLNYSWTSGRPTYPSVFDQYTWNNGQTGFGGVGTPGQGTWGYDYTYSAPSYMGNDIGQGAWGYDYNYGATPQYASPSLSNYMTSE